MVPAIVLALHPDYYKGALLLALFFVGVQAAQQAPKETQSLMITPDW